MMEYEILTRSLKDSAAHSKLKLLKDGETFGVEKPGGEKRIHIGSISENARWDSFFFPKGGQTFIVTVLKIDLIKYLLEAKNEYLNPHQSYRLKISDYYDDLYKQTLDIPDESFQVCFEKNTDDKRYYLTRPSGNELSKNYNNIINICLPIVTQYVFLRVKDGDSFVFYLIPEYKPDFTTPDLTKSNSNSEDHILQIFYGAPGTGKTRCMQKEYYDQYPDEHRLFTTFHQSYSYEDFVEGLKPVLDERAIGDEEKQQGDIKYTIEKGVFYRACERAAKLAGYDNLQACIKDSKEGRAEKFTEAIQNGDKMLLCIDEINRGNIASIFGDLISLIEPSKRLGSGEHELMVTLPYSKKRFGVPTNLIIIGTMNTADRSIQLLDSALRRRFEFREFLPDYSAITNPNAKKILEGINSRIRSLLNKDNQIGHSYFINVANDVDIVKAMINKIIPLLEEYFYNDIEKVRFVLNETKTDDNTFYVEDKEASKAYDDYQNTIDGDETKKLYVLNEAISKAVQENNTSECGKFLINLLKHES